MMGAVRAELRKLLSVRSTYVLTLVIFGLLVFFALYVDGYKNGPEVLRHGMGHAFLAGSINQLAAIIGLFTSIVALLLFSHEYRYNTIIYALTAARSRSRVLWAKALVIFGYVLVVAGAGLGMSLVLQVAGLHLSGHSLPPQDINYLHFFAKAIFYCEGLSLMALAIVVLVRNQVASLVILLVAPSTVENLLGLLLKHHQQYLPFTALGQVIAAPAAIAGAQAAPSWQFSPHKSAAIFTLYLLVTWTIAWFLFVRRDAN